MKTRFFSTIGPIACLALVLILVPGGTLRMQAQEPQPPILSPEKLPCSPNDSAGSEGIDRFLQKSPEGQWYLPDKIHLPLELANATPRATGGPDDFGYTWNDAAPLNWINATGGTNTGLGGNTRVVGPIFLPFSFKFYENTYNQIYISKYGYAGFTNDNLTRSQGRIVGPDTPNNIIAPYWVPSLVNESGYTGQVYYMAGGTTPNRYFVIEWHQIRGSYLPTENVYTFEVILYENGDILVQHATMTYGSGWVCGHVGIEDSEGLDGLAYGSFCQQYASNKAIRFYRPTPSARVQVRPAFHGRLAKPSETVSFQQRIRNTGELGADTYDLTTYSTWSTYLYAADGVTPLTDTDGDGIVDTGSIAQGGSAYITVIVQAPAGGTVGDDNSANVVIRSSLNTFKQKTATFQTAIPAPFAQIFRDNADGAQSLYLVQPGTQSTRKVTSNYYYGYDGAVAEMPNSNFVYVWSKYRSIGNLGIYELEYTLLNRTGGTVRGVTRLTDHSGATLSTYDEIPTVSAAPNGRIGLLWYRYLYNSSNSTWNGNLYYAILDASGNLIVAPTNLTNNPLWGYG